MGVIQADFHTDVETFGLDLGPSECFSGLTQGAEIGPHSSGRAYPLNRFNALFKGGFGVISKESFAFLGALHAFADKEVDHALERADFADFQL